MLPIHLDGGEIIKRKKKTDHYKISRKYKKCCFCFILGQIYKVMNNADSEELLAEPFSVINQFPDGGRLSAKWHRHLDKDRFGENENVTSRK